MSKPVIITCAVTGSIHTPTMSPHLPITPAEIADAAIGAAEAGAAVIHARHPENGRPDYRPETFLEFLPRIKKECDAVINISTGGGMGMTIEERLAAALTASPEMASLNMGSMNFGIFPLAEKYSEWKYDWEQDFLASTKDFIFPNTRFEFECYDLGHLYNLAHVVDKGFVKPPFFIQLIFGILGGAGADPDNLTHMHNTAIKLFGEDFEWSVLAAGRHQMPFATQASLRGGNVRVGLEDSLYIGKRELATSNAQQVEKVRGIIESLGMTAATPDEARDRLALKGADRVEF